MRYGEYRPPNWKRMLIVILVVVIAWGLYWEYPFRVRIPPEEVALIEINDRLTGKTIMIEDREIINHIIEDLNEITYEKEGLFQWHLGASFATTIYRKDMTVYKEFTISGSRSVIKNGTHYSSKTSRGIDIDLIYELCGY